MSKENKNRIDIIYCMNETDKEKEKNAKAMNVYKNLVSCTGMNYSKLISSMSEKLGREVDIDFLKDNIKRMKKSINTRNAEEMVLIIKYAMAISRKDKKEILLNRVALSRIQDVNNGIKNITKETDYMSNRSKELRSDSVEEITKKLKSISKEGKITEENELTNREKFKLRKYLTEFDKELYMNYIFISNSKIESISLSEMNEIIYVLTYFINHLEKNINNIDFDLDIFSDIKKTPNITSTGITLKKWKAKRAKILLDTYIRYREMLLKIRDEKVLDSKNDISNKDKKLLKEEEDFLYDYYNKIKSVMNIKSTIVDSISLKDENKKQYIKMFTNRVIVDDRKNE